MKLSIKTKLLLLFLITIIVSLLVNSSIYFTNLKNEYLNDFYKRTEMDINIVNANIDEYDNKMKKITKSISNDKEVISILNLISNYQNKKNYNTILFDEEKTKLLKILNSKINIAEHFSYEVMDKEYIPIAINRMDNDHIHKGIFTYKNGKLQFLNYDTKQLFDFTYKCKLYFDEIKKCNSMFYFQDNNFSLRHISPIYKSKKIVGYFVIRKHFKQSNIQRLLKNTNNKFSFIFKETAIGNIEDVNIRNIKQNSTNFANEIKTYKELFDDESYYYHSHYLRNIKNEKLYFVSAIDKKLLKYKIKELIAQLIISIIIATAISFSLISLFLKNSLFNRINKLTDAIEQIKKKNYITIDTKDDDEISKVAQELNNLTKTIQTNFKTIENLNDFLQRVLDTVPVRIFWKDLEGKYLGANKLFINDCNLASVNQLIGKSDFELPWANTEAKKFVADDKEVIESKQPKLLLEEILTQVDGTKIHLMTSKVPLLDKNKNIIGILGVYDDITTMKKTQEELREKTSVMFEQSKLAAMGEMLESIAHQWRQPLSVISTSASGLKMQKEYDMLDDEQLVDYLDTILNSANHLSQTIEDFRNFYEEDKDKKLFNIKICLEKTLELMSSKLKNRGISVVLNSINLDIKGFENELIQVFMNIINNAKDELEEQTLDRKLLFINVEKHNSILSITFQDNANGIDENILNRVFEHRFTTKQHKHGTGIGLYMSRLIINKAMGKIDVENKEFEYKGKKYKGACFKIILPLKY